MADEDTTPDAIDAPDAAEDAAPPAHGPPPGRPDEKAYWLDNPKNVDRIFYALCTACAALVLADFAYHKHGHFDFEEMTGFHGLFGFGAYVGLVLSATQLRRVLKRDEDYYD